MSTSRASCSVPSWARNGCWPAVAVTSSTSASLGSVLPTAGLATYGATKHAVLGYTDTVRLENRGTRRALLGDHADLDEYRDDCRFRTREGLQECRAGRRGPGGSRSDRETETARFRSPFDRHCHLGAAFHAATRIGGDWTRARDGSRVAPATSEPTSARPMPGGPGRPEFVSTTFHPDVKLIAPQVISKKSYQTHTAPAAPT